MYRFTFFRYLLLCLVTTVALTACGGGKNNGDSVPQSSASVAVSAAFSSSLTQPSSVTVSSASSTVVSSSFMSSAASSTPSDIQLRLKGAVGFDDLKGATVEVQVGGQVFSSQVLDDLTYSITLRVASVDEHKPLVITATGGPGTGWIKLASILPSAHALQGLGNTEGEVSAQSQPELNLTEITSAYYALAKSNNNLLITEQDRLAALTQANDAFVVQYAAILKLILTDYNYTLPRSYANTLDFLADPTARSLWVNVLQQRGSNHKNVLRTIYPTFLSNGLIKQAPFNWVGRFILTSDTKFDYYLELNADGTGLIKTSENPLWGVWMRPGNNIQKQTALNWVRRGATMEITFKDNIIYKPYSWVSEPPNEDEFPQSEYGYGDSCTPSDTIENSCAAQFSGIKLENVFTGASSKVVQAYLQLNTTNQAGEVAHDFSKKPYLTRIVPLSIGEGPKPEALLQSEWYNGSNKFTFLPDGKVQVVNLLSQVQAEVNWELKGNELQLDDGNAVIWFKQANGAGYEVFESMGNKSLKLLSARVQGDAFIQRRLTSLSADNWYGRWSDVYANWGTEFFDFHPEYVWSKGVFSQPTNTLKQSTSTQLDLTIAQTYSNHSTFDVLSEIGGRYWASRCYGDEGNAQFNYCYISFLEKDPTFKAKKVWDIEFSALFRQDNGLPIFAGYSGAEINGRLVQVSDTSWYRPATDQVVEVIDASTNSAKVCLYPWGKTCAMGKSISLQTGIRVAITGNGPLKMVWQEIGASTRNGYEFPNASSRVVLTSAPNKPIKFTLESDGVLSVKRVTGCGVEPVFDQFEWMYTIAGRNTDCEVVFELNEPPMPVVLPAP